MTTLQADAAGEFGIAVVTNGAPDVLLTRCTAERTAREVRPMSGARRAAILANVERLADLALRTLAVAYRPLADGDLPEPDESVERDLIYLGLVGIIDPPRPEARTSIAEAADAGIRAVMITGDHPITAARIADDLGIAGRGARADRRRARGARRRRPSRGRCGTSRVYARVAPEHKLRIVDARCRRTATSSR